jgi:hypothetical protein
VWRYQFQCQSRCFGRHVVEHDALRAQGRGLAHVVQRPALDLQGRAGRIGGAHAAHGLGDGAGVVDVVVLEHEHLFEVGPVVVATAHAHGVFLEIALAGGGLAGVQDTDARAFHCQHETPCGVGYAGEVADEVHDDPFGLQQDRCRGQDAGHLAAALHGIAVVRQEGHGGVGAAHAFEDDAGQGQPGHEGVLLGHDGRAQQGRGREEGLGGQVPAVLLQRQVHQAVEHGQALVTEELKEHA